MLETKQPPEYTRDELDLVDLFENFFSFFKAYGRRILIFTLAGMMVGYVLYKLAPRQYASSMLLHSYILSNTEQIKIIENWNELLKNNEYSTLSQRLNCDQSTLRQVKKISAAEIQKLYIPNNPNGFLVEAIVKNNNVLDTLGQGIVYGLENATYIKAKLDSRRATLMQLIEKVEAEILKLDSTKKAIENSINNNGTHVSSFIVDVSSINSEVIGLQEKLLGYRDELKFTKAVQILQKFERFDKPAAPKLFKSLALGLIGGFALGFFASAYSWVRKRIRGRHRL